MMILVGEETGGPSSSSSWAAQLPLGVKFAPTVQELLGYYLYNHVQGTLPEDHYSVISRQHLYGGEEPWKVWERLQSGGETHDVYVFTDLKKANDGGKRWCRKVGKKGGSWHGEDTGTKFKLFRRRPVAEEGWMIGTRKRYIYRNPNPNPDSESESEDGKWILHEYSLSMDPAQPKNICSRVLCVLRNNDSPSANAVVEAGRRSALAARKRDLQGYIDLLVAGNSKKRPRLDVDASPAQSQQPPPPSASGSACSNPVAVESWINSESNKRLCIVTSPTTTQQSHQQPSSTASGSDNVDENTSRWNPFVVEHSESLCVAQQFQQQPSASGSVDYYDDEKASCSNHVHESLDLDQVLGCIDFDSCVPELEIDWTTCADCDDTSAATTSNTEAQSELDVSDFELAEPLQSLVDDDKGKQIMDFDSPGRIVLPPYLHDDKEGAGDNGVCDYGSTNQLEILQAGFGGGGFSDLFGMGLPYCHSPSSWELQANGSWGMPQLSPLLA